jgi:signal transduction histidine kinase/CheY-like chemotaxis protein
LISFDPAKSSSYDTYEWIADGIGPQPIQILPWYQQQIASGDVIVINDLSELPPEASEERAAFAARGLRSSLGIPVKTGELLVGFLAMESIHSRRSWSVTDITIFKLIGELFASALRRKRAEDDLRDSQSQLFQAQKIDAVGRLAGGIAHDFNNLLTVILGFSKSLIEDLKDEDPNREDAREIHSAASKAAALTGQLLAFSRHQLTETQAVALDETLVKIAPLLRRLLGEDIHVHFDLSPKLAAVEGNPTQLEQAIINLAVNARDAMPGGGQLRIQAGMREIDSSEASRLALNRSGRHAELRVSDDGTGIDPETVAYIFEPFFTTKEPGRGTGLGLSIVYRIVRQCGGAISVSSELGRGSTFTLLLPTIEGKPPVEARPLDTPLEAGSETLLLVEDEPSVRRLARRILAEHGYRILEASNGAEALELALRTPHPIHLLVSDVVMPTMGGGELARTLLQSHPGMRILFLSGYPLEQQGGEHNALPAGGFLQKPFSDRSLLAKVRESLDERRDD